MLHFLCPGMKDLHLGHSRSDICDLIKRNTVHTYVYLDQKIWIRTTVVLIPYLFKSHVTYKLFQQFNRFPIKK